MKKRAVLLSCLLMLSVTTTTQAASSRNMCQKFFVNWDLSTCIQRQEASARKYAGWKRSKISNSQSWAKSCTPQNKLSYGVTHYINYVGVEECVMELKKEKDKNDAIARQKTIINFN